MEFPGAAAVGCDVDPGTHKPTRASHAEPAAHAWVSLQPAAGSGPRRTNTNWPWRETDDRPGTLKVTSAAMLPLAPSKLNAAAVSWATKEPVLPGASGVSQVILMEVG